MRTVRCSRVVSGRMKDCYGCGNGAGAELPGVPVGAEPDGVGLPVSPGVCGRSGRLPGIMGRSAETLGGPEPSIALVIGLPAGPPAMTDGPPGIMGGPPGIIGGIAGWGSRTRVLAFSISSAVGPMAMVRRAAGDFH